MTTPTETALKTEAADVIAQLALTLASRADVQTLARVLRAAAERLDHAADLAEGADRPRERPADLTW